MRIKLFLLNALGFSLLGLGAIGLLLPVWPTTPFVIAAFACFAGSPSVRARIMKIPFFCEHIENYRLRTGLSQRTVAVSLIYLCGMLLLSMLLTKTFLIAILLIAVGAAVTVHILWIAKSAGERKVIKE